MEGNTYNILETERLIKFGAEAEGKDRKEAVMILNHKAAIRHVVDNLAVINVGRRDLFDIHALLADGLLVDPAMAGRLRRMPVGISYSSYRPLDDAPSIEEEFDVLIGKAAAIEDPFEQSFFLMVHIPYLQAFEDVNKRTSRIAANIPLLKADLAPMSFLTMNDKDYIDGLIGIYELNDISLFRDAYIGVYLASADNYRAARRSGNARQGGARLSRFRARRGAAQRAGVRRVSPGSARRYGGGGRRAGDGSGGCRAVYRTGTDRTPRREFDPVSVAGGGFAVPRSGDVALLRR